jgi:hypothetical protein
VDQTSNNDIDTSARAFLHKEATTHTIVEAIARQQQLTESAWLRRLIETTLQSSGVVLQAGSNDEPPRQAIACGRPSIAPCTG